MKRLLMFIAGLFVVALPILASAAEVQIGENYSFAQGEVAEGNFYAAGANLVFSGDVKGDVSAAGASITLKGEVAEDVALAGATIVLDGTVTGDARIVGGDVTVSGIIGGDLAAAGGTVQIMSGAKITGDVLIAAGTVVIDGEVGGDVRLTGGDVMIIGEVKGTVWNYAERLTLSATAMVGGDVTNYAGAPAVITQGAIINGQSVHEPMVAVDGFRGAVAAAGTMSFLMFLLAGLICLWLFKNRSKQFTAHALAHFGREVLRGIVLLVAIPVIALLLFLSIVGAPLGVIVLLIYITSLLLAKVFTGIMLGGWINKVVFKKPDQVFTWQTVIGGNVVLLFLGFLPVIGGIISFLFMVLAFGAFWGYLYRHFWANR